MRFHDTEIPLETTRRFQILDITGTVQDAVKASGIARGLALVRSPHTTASIRVNENEPRLHEDMERFLCDLAHPEGAWRHNLQTVDDRPNAWGHLMSLLLGGAAVLPVTEGRIDLGGWQSVFFVELDGPRAARKAFVRVMGA